MLALCALLFLATVDATTWSIRKDGTHWRVSEGRQGDDVAYCSFSDSRTEDGWTRLSLTIEGEASMDKYYAAGYLEGYVTAEFGFAAYYNFANSTGLPMSEKAVGLMNATLSWMLEQVASQATDPYWQRLGLALAQYNGMMDGYNAASPAENQLSRTKLLAYALQFEIGDYEQAASGSPLFHFDDAGRRIASEPNHPMWMSPSMRRRLEGEHCSAMVKPVGANVVAGHVTWSSFNCMLRVYKTYDFPTGKTQFSSFPLLPFSGDDWFVTGRGLIVTETTNELFNTSSYVYLTATTVPYWLRIQVACDAPTPVEWHNLFSRNNNGGYNNQWMVVDTAAFSSGSPAPNSFVVGEQAPGLYIFRDQTAHVMTEKYWSSYNIPFYPEVWEYMGYRAMYDKFGNAWSHDECARATIFRRDHAKVTNVDTLQHMLRYNQWQVDPLSLGDACRGISARCDLNDPFAHPINKTMNGFNAFGAIDGKVADSSMVKALKSAAVCGPSWQEQPIFWWSPTWSDVPCKMCPKSYMFPWVEMGA